jgi:hypothetical protein
MLVIKECKGFLVVQQHEAITLQCVAHLMDNVRCFCAVPTTHKSGLPIAAKQKTGAHLGLQSYEAEFVTEGFCRIAWSTPYHFCTLLTASIGALDPLLG